MHRDVKPHNVMIDHENRKVRIRLPSSDLGSQKLTQVSPFSSYSCDSSTGAWQNSTTPVLSIMSG